jgi:hypothetical protein
MVYKDVFVGTLLFENDWPSRSLSKLIMRSSMFPRPAVLHDSQKVFLSKRAFMLLDVSALLDCNIVLLEQFGHSKKIFMNNHIKTDMFSL